MVSWIKEKGKNSVIGGRQKRQMSGKAKNGIRRIQSDEEIFKAFADEDVSPAESKDGDSKDLTQDRGDKSADIPEKKSEVRIQKDKHGFTVLDHTENLSALLESKAVADKNGEMSQNQISARSGKGGNLKTKHGLPILDKEADFKVAFEDASEENGFSEILSKSLGEKTQGVLLKEKKDRVGPQKQLSIKQRLSRYPMPQGQLDLHGHTAIKADLKAEAYIKNAFFNGTYTIRIIVGKGLHSKDGPVLPDIIEKRVVALKNEKIIFHYEWDKKKKSKSGSLIIYLSNYYRLNQDPPGVY